MATVTSVYAIDYVAEILNEKADLLRAIIRNDDNLTYGNIVSVMTGDDDSIPALTDDGIDELRQMLTDARTSAKNWQEFLDCFVDDEEVVPVSRHLSCGRSYGRNWVMRPIRRRG